MKKILLICLICGFCLPVRSFAAQQPQEAIQGPIDRALEILRDPAFKEPGKKNQQRDKMWEVIRPVFDFTEVAKRALARNWKDFSPEQRKSFTDVFSELLGYTYLKKIQSEYSNQRVEFISQEKIGENRAVVETKIVREQLETPVDYSMHLVNGEWKVYDVQIEGVSLVKNYRTQFNQILFKEKPAALIERLKDKVAKQKAGQEDDPEHAEIPGVISKKLTAWQLKAAGSAVVAGGLQVQSASGLQ